MTKQPLNKLQKNALTIREELNWFTQILDIRIKNYFQQECAYEDVYDLPPPSLEDNFSIYAETVRHYQMTTEERLVLLLALIPHFCPQLLDVFFIKNEKYGRGFSEFGGVKGNQHGGFLPTGETAAFLLACNDLTRRFRLSQFFEPHHFFSRHRILELSHNNKEEPLLSGSLIVSKEYLSYFTSGKQYTPPFSSQFPAKLITTNLSWDDLILENYILEEIQEILNWIIHQNTIMDDWGLRKVLKPGFRSLFYGPPGTGKTLTASLLGKASNMDVYRVDLSKVVSKYIGETEKNLANIFDQAENKSWILFFDEADALFGKRTSNSDAKDRYANQEVAYLLQRIEDFPGIVILASNLKSNIDEAFARRFQSIIYFPIPRPEQRLQLWQSAFKKIKLDESVSLNKIAENYELTGGAIINILRYCALMAVTRTPQVILASDLISGIRKELKKEGKTI